MDNSVFIASLIGPALMAIAVAILTNRRALEAMAGQMPDNLAVVFLAGLALLVIGIAIVRVHGAWSNDWTVIVTLFGWLAMLGGLVRMMIPEKAAALANEIIKNRVATLSMAVFMLLIGGFLTLKGFAFLA